MNHNLYLLWIPNEGWGTFDEGTSPDLHNVFPEYIYRKYTVSAKDEEKVFHKLRSVQQELNSKGVVPTEERQNEIFPELSDLLSD